MVTRVTLKGVHKVRAKGRDYYYHRATRTRLMAVPGTAAFIAEVARLDAAAEARAPREGTLAGLIARYRQSPEFQRLSPRTRKDYDAVFAWLARIGDAAVADFTPALVMGVRDKAFARRKRRFANYAVQVLRLLFAWGRLHGLCGAENPAAGVPQIAKPKDERRWNRPWTAEEQRAVLAAAPIHVRWPLALAMFAGLSEGDLVDAPASALHDGALRLDRGKTGVPVAVPLHRDLKAVRATYEKWAKAQKVQALKLCVNSRGRAWTANGLRAVVFKLMRALEAEGRVGPHLTIHGLRHTVGNYLAELGCAPQIIQAMLAHKTRRMAELYSDRVNRERLVREGVKAMERDARTRRKRQTRGKV